MMTESEFLNALQNDILPIHYRTDISKKIPDGCLLFRKGAYVCLAMPFEDVPDDDFGSHTAKKMIRGVMTCLPFLMEKGLFLVYYGPEEKWSPVASKFTVDKTALRPVILQSIHFFDPRTGQNENSRTHWGPLKFGFCGKLIEDLETLGRKTKGE